MKPPEGAIIDAVWRCKRGHEEPASWTIDGQGSSWTFFQIELHDGSKHAICMACLIEDYNTQKVEFKDG